MTRTEALKEARRRWGEYGHVERSRIWPGGPRCFVYEAHPDKGMGEDASGSGPSWEAAFADADRRAGEVLP